MSIDPLSLRIGFLAGTLGRGGAERQLVYMLQALKNEGVKSRVLCLTKGEAFEKDIMDLGVNIDWVGSSSNNLVRLMNIIGNIRRNPVDLIQSAHFYTNIYVALAGLALGVASVGAIRSDVTNELSTNRTFGRWHLNLPKHLIANSQLAVDRAVSKGVDKSRVHHVKNAVADGNNRSPFDDKMGVNLLFAGRLDPPKRPELFIDMAAALRELHPKLKLRFLIAGDGPLRPLLENMVKERKFRNDELSFLGEQSNMSEIYERSDILVLTSQREGTPNVVLEAMANGLAVVATRVGGVSDLLAEGRGLLVQSGDLEGLVLASKLLIVDKALRKHLGDAGKKYIGEHHSLGGLQARLMEIYEKLA